MVILFKQTFQLLHYLFPFSLSAKHVLSPHALKCFVFGRSYNIRYRVNIRGSDTYIYITLIFSIYSRYILNFYGYGIKLSIDICMLKNYFRVKRELQLKIISNSRKMIFFLDLTKKEKVSHKIKWKKY